MQPHERHPDRPLDELEGALAGFVREALPPTADNAGAEALKDESKSNDEAQQRSIASLKFQSKVHRFLNQQRYTHNLFWLMAAWLVLVAGVVIACGLHAPKTEAPPVVIVGWWGLFALLTSVMLAVYLWRCNAAQEARDHLAACAVNHSPSIAHYPLLGKNGRIFALLNAYVPRKLALSRRVLLGALEFYQPIGWAVVLALFACFLRSLESDGGTGDERHSWTLALIYEFSLPESVQIALIGGTSVNVLGLFVLVARHLFRANKENNAA